MSSTRSKTAKPTGLVSIAASAWRGRGRRALLLVGEQPLAAGAGGEAAEHQQVVPRGVVEVRGQLVVQQVADMQVDQLTAGPALQRRLHVGDADLELAPARCASQTIAAAPAAPRAALQLGELVADDVEEAHRGGDGSAQRVVRSRRAASSAK